MLDPGAHDLVIHALALHWADDPVGQLVQCRRALNPDGLFLGMGLGGQTLAELRAALAEAETQLSGGLSPRVLPMGEIRDLGALLQRAGFALPVADSVPLNASYADAFALMHDLRAMGETNALAARHRAIPSRALFPTMAACYNTSFPAPDGRIRATFEIIALTGWAPAETQPRALRPGSAGMRLADALGSTETALPDAVDLPRGD
jgi:SAM-dependent methyltransferase